MKKILCLLFFSLLLHAGFAQEEGPGEVKLREKMIEYIQNKLGLTRTEAEKFQPVYTNYLKELKRTNRELKGQDVLERQQKLLDVRLRYREQFKAIIGEKRSNDVFQHEGEFLKTIRQEIKERRQERLEGRANKKNIEILLAN